MFLGHFALGMAGKKISHRTSLGTLFLAAQFLDLLWPFFLLIGLETVAIDPGNTAFTPLAFLSYPFSHSLVAALFWGLLFGLVHFIYKRSSRRALLLGLLVISHWLLDFITHRPDLPLGLNESTKVGLGLWNYKAATLLIECLLFGISVYTYNRSTKAINKTGRYAWWTLVAFLLLIYILNVLGDPPPNAHVIGYVGLAQWLIIAWGYWVDHNRKPVSSFVHKL